MLLRPLLLLSLGLTSYSLWSLPISAKLDSRSLLQNLAEGYLLSTKTNEKKKISFKFALVSKWTAGPNKFLVRWTFETEEDAKIKVIESPDKTISFLNEGTGAIALRMYSIEFAYFHPAMEDPYLITISEHQDIAAILAHFQIDFFHIANPGDDLASVVMAKDAYDGELLESHRMLQTLKKIAWPIFEKVLNENEIKIIKKDWDSPIDEAGEEE